MVCGDKLHLNMKHACCLCENYNIDVLMYKPTTDVCIKCKSGECQFVRIIYK